MDGSTTNKRQIEGDAAAAQGTDEDNQMKMNVVGQVAGTKKRQSIRMMESQLSDGNAMTDSIKQQGQKTGAVETLSRRGSALDVQRKLSLAKKRTLQKIQLLKIGQKAASVLKTAKQSMSASQQISSGPGVQLIPQGNNNAGVIQRNASHPVIYKLGIGERMKLLYFKIIGYLRNCIESVINLIYPQSRQSGYQRKEHSMKFFPLENVGMCLDEYLYRFERVDDNEEFLKKEREENEEDSDEERNDLADARRVDRDQFSQFWQWNYMVIDNDGKTKEPWQFQGEGENDVRLDEDDEESEDEFDQDEDDLKNQFQIQSMLNTKLKEMKREYAALRKEVKNVTRSYKKNSREIDSIHLQMAKFTIDYDEQQDNFMNAFNQNAALKQARKHISAVEDGMKHIKLKNY